MNLWIRRARAAVLMGLLWALGGIAIGGAIELLDNILPAAHGFTRLVDMWPQTLALLAFPHGVLFAIVLGVAGRHRRFGELSLSQFAAWGGLAGIFVGALIVLALGAPIPFVALTTLLSAAGGATSFALARKAERLGWIGGTAPKPALSMPNDDQGGSERIQLKIRRDPP